MKLLELINRLEGCFSVLKSFNDESIIINSYSLLLRDQTQFVSGCLYIGMISTLPSKIYLIDATFLCIGDTTEPYEKIKDINLCIVKADITHYEILNKVSEIMNEEITLSIALQKLFNAGYSNLGLQHLIDTATDIFGHPMLLADATFKILAFSYEVSTEVIFSEAANGDRYLTETTITYIRNNTNIRSQKRSDGLSHYVKKADPLHGILTSLIRIEGVEIATLAIYEAGKEFQEIDSKLMDSFCKLLSVELQKTNIFNINTKLIPNYILSDLLEKKINDEDTVNRRFHYLKWATFKNLHIVVITNREIGTFDSKIPFIIQSLQAFVPISNCIVYKSALVAFIDDSLFHSLFHDENQEFIEYLRFNYLYAGVSLKFTKLSESRKYYLQALKASEIGGRYNLQLSNYEKCTLYIIADLISSQYDIQDFCHPAVLQLAKEDSEHNTDFLKTLKYYIYFTTAPNDAAKALNIHRSTLFYRINKIKQLTGILLDTADENYQIYFSIKLLEISNSVVK